MVLVALVVGPRGRPTHITDSLQSLVTPIFRHHILLRLPFPSVISPFPSPSIHWSHLAYASVYVFVTVFVSVSMSLYLNLLVTLSLRFRVRFCVRVCLCLYLPPHHCIGHIQHWSPSPSHFFSIYWSHLVSVSVSGCVFISLSPNLLVAPELE